MNSRPIHEIKTLIDENKLNENIFEQLKTDPRKGVQRLLAIYERRQAEKVKRTEQFMKIHRFDQQFRKNNSFLLAGVDEAGRGPLAGPIVAAAVILPADFIEIGMNDSKQITDEERKRLFDIIIEKAISYSVSVIDNKIIDQLNILNATKKAMVTSLNSLSVKPDLALIDAVKLNQIEIDCQEIIKGDEKSSSIAAASILAKVTRDEIMDEMDLKYPAYDFKNNKGYGTKKHLHALHTVGPTTIHRVTFSPVQEAMLKKEDLL